jgi:hypothetical protein
MRSGEQPSPQGSNHHPDRVPLRKRIRQILKEETHQVSGYHRLKDHYPDTKWLEIKIEEPGELCIDEKKLYRILSNSKQSVGGESNRDWWRKWVIWGFYHYWCKPNFQVTKFYLLVHDIVSPIVLTSRVRKAVGFNADLSVTEVESPQYPSTSEGHHAFINKHYKPTNS